MAAHVISDDPKPLGQQCDDRVPKAQVGAQRVCKEEGWGGLWPLHTGKEPRSLCCHKMILHLPSFIKGTLTELLQGVCKELRVDIPTGNGRDECVFV